MSFYGKSQEGNVDGPKCKILRNIGPNARYRGPESKKSKKGHASAEKCG